MTGPKCWDTRKQRDQTRLRSDGSDQERQRRSKRETGSRRQCSLKRTRSESLSDAEFVAGMRAPSVAWLPASRAMDRARERRRSPPVTASPRRQSSAGYITNIDWRRRPRNLRPDICGPQRTRRRRIRKPRTGTATPDRRELLNHTAGNAGASVARRIGLHVVCLLGDHNTGTARVEQRSGAIAGEGNVLDGALEGTLAVRADCQIRQITSVMTFWVLHAMLLVRRTEVATRRREARGIALTGFVDVDGVNSRTQICNRHRHLDAAFGCCELRLAGILIFHVLDSGCRRLRSFSALAMVPQVAPSSSSAIAAHKNFCLFIRVVSSSDWNSHSGL